MVDTDQGAAASADRATSPGRDSLPGDQVVENYEREATELAQMEQHETHLDRQPQLTQNPGHAGSKKQPNRELPWYHPLIRWWTNYVYLTVPHKECRDHLANERTYLAYMRTSLALSMMGVTISQLLRLQHSITPSHVYGYYILGRPLGVFFQVVAMILSVIGGHRYWRQQMSMARGKVWAGGWEIYLIMLSMLMLMCGIFALLLAADVKLTSSTS